MVRAVVAASSTILQEAQRLFRPFGITAAHFNVLELLADAEAGLRPSDITRSLVVDPSSTTYLLDQIKEKGWIRRVAEPADRRAYRVVLTPSGRRLHQEVSRQYEQALVQIASSLGEVPWQAIGDTLDRFSTAAVEVVAERSAAFASGAGPR